jgi:hypothetical protein
MHSFDLVSLILLETLTQIDQTGLLYPCCRNANQLCCLINARLSWTPLVDDICVGLHRYDRAKDSSTGQSLMSVSTRDCIVPSPVEQMPGERVNGC